MPKTRIQALVVRPAISRPVVASIIPNSMAVSVRMCRVSQATPTTPMMMNRAFALSSTCCGIIGPRVVCCTRVWYRLAGSQRRLSAMPRLSTQSAMKFGCRSQSWYIIIQKHDMIAIQMISRISRMPLIVRHSTA